MSSTIDPAPVKSSAESSVDARLAGLRAELDRLDDVLHDALMARAAVVAQVATLKGGANALRAGREASIIRRILARHDGGLPPLAIARIWREMLAGTTGMQAPFAIAVGGSDPALLALAREHFGALTPHRTHGSPALAIGEVSAGTASAAVLPVPTGDEERAPWWTALLQKDEPRIHVVARLPFWQARPEGAPRGEALVVASTAPDPSGDDRTLLGLELDGELSRGGLATALAAAGLEPDSVQVFRPSAAPVAFALIDVAGFVTEDDARLEKLGIAQRRPVILGAYAVAIGR